jgi:hypothetical protein
MSDTVQYESITKDGNFFTNDVFSEMNKNGNLQEHLKNNNLLLLNRADIIDWLIMTRPIGTFAYPRKAKTKEANELSLQKTAVFSDIQFSNFINQLTESQCNNGINGINEMYGKWSIHSSVVDNDKFDILVVVDSNYKNVKPGATTPEDFIDFKISQVKGFIIVERGECKKYSNRHAVKLICSTHHQGTLLMGLYMYTLLNNSKIYTPDKIGILELASGYINVPGLCTYHKFGFTEDKDLYGNNCFTGMGSMPMSVDLNIGKNQNLSDDIIQVAIGEKRHLFPSDTGNKDPIISNICMMKTDKEKQIELASNTEITRRDEILAMSVGCSGLSCIFGRGKTRKKNSGGRKTRKKNSGGRKTRKKNSGGRKTRKAKRGRKLL